MATRTGNFPIGFRRGWLDWQKKDLKSLAEWAKKTGFDVIDLMNLTKADFATMQTAGMRIGSGDLLDFGALMSSEEGKRKELIARNVAYVKEIGGAGAKAFFTCIIPGDPGRKRSENYALAVECFAPIA